MICQLNYWVSFEWARKVESEEVMGEENLTGASGSVGGTVKTRTLRKARVRHPKCAEGGLRDSARFEL